MNIHAHGAGDVLRRREEILRIVREQSVHSQEELLKILRRHGVTVTQPTLSRDLRELGLVKTANGYVAPGDLASVTPIAAFTARETLIDRFEAAVRDAVTAADAAGNLVVIRTPVAAAQPVASAIDGANLDDVLGTIGGDDTIFIAFRTPSAAAAFVRRVHSIAGLTPNRRVAR